LSRKQRFAVRSVKHYEAKNCLTHYLKDYDGILCTGIWKDRVRDDGITTWHMGIEDSWVELEMTLGHLPSFMTIIGHPVILDIEMPEIRTITNPKWRTTLHKWSIWSGPPRPAYKLTIYDDYLE